MRGEERRDELPDTVLYNTLTPPHSLFRSRPPDPSLELPLSSPHPSLSPAPPSREPCNPRVLLPRRRPPGSLRCAHERLPRRPRSYRGPADDHRWPARIACVFQTHLRFHIRRQPALRIPEEKLHVLGLGPHERYHVHPVHEHKSHGR